MEKGRKTHIQLKRQEELELNTPLVHQFLVHIIYYLVVITPIRDAVFKIPTLVNENNTQVQRL